MKNDGEKFWAIVAYVFFPLPLIFVKHKSPFLNYHINQGIILMAVSIAGQFGIWLLFGWFSFLAGLFKLCVVILFIIGIINVMKKRMKPLPVIGDLFTVIQ